MHARKPPLLLEILVAAEHSAALRIASEMGKRDAASGPRSKHTGYEARRTS